MSFQIIWRLFPKFSVSYAIGCLNDNNKQAIDGEAKAKPEVIKLGLDTRAAGSATPEIQSEISPRIKCSSFGPNRLRFQFATPMEDARQFGWQVVAAQYASRS
jgi:hypothetical protein